MKNYLVTGAAGFIGANYLKYILAKHDDVRVVVLDLLTYAGYLGTIAGDVDNERCFFVKGDICDRPLLDRLFAEYKFDVVVNFAAESHVDRSIDNPQLFLQTNILGTQNLLDAARAKGGAAYGLLFSARFFGVLHFYPAAVVNAFVMGLLLGFIYIRSNSLYIVVILHAFNNALAMLLLTLGYAHTTLYELMSAHGLKMLYTVVYGVSLGIFLVAGYMVWKTIARLREQEQAAAEAQ